MILAFSLTVAVVFGSGVFLVIQRDLLRVVIGIVLISNSASLFIVAAGSCRGPCPYYLSRVELELRRAILWCRRWR